jgi:protein CWC15
VTGEEQSLTERTITNCPTGLACRNETLTPFVSLSLFLEPFSDDDDDDEDDTAELLRELEKIKRERAEEKERQEKLQAEEENKEREAQAAIGNPLLNVSDSSSGSKDFSVKRRWDDDVIFRNQARGMDDKPKKRFINDTLRSDFHRRFMKQYVQ